jgi:hypothetical protein
MLTAFVVAAQLAAGDADYLRDLEGVYQSSRLGGCTLQLVRSGAFTLVCASNPEHRGEAIVLGRGLLIPGASGPDDLPAPPGRIILPQPSLPGATPSWPPSVADPTSGPYLLDAEAYLSPLGVALFLEPLRWGSRLYLISSGDRESFCDEIKVGTEPRRSAVGQQFLRRGDHR